MGLAAYRSVLIASLSTLLALGLFRFAYSALLPLLIAAQWFDAKTALYLSTANLCGYLIGALSANPLNQRYNHTQLICVAAFVGSMSLLACAIAHLPIAWYVFWRLLAGITGAWLMVLA
ncbi:MAG TPA: YbfB/YjiJ family MFS transporter, partial [Vitreoscilla sp.]|nr:YbfB/YjiJ family MFS transporter [Vitreoscilla sp.]